MTGLKIPELIVLGLLELAAVAMIVRLWLKQTPRRWWKRILWSVILLVPLFGILAYGLMTMNMDEDPADKKSDLLDIVEETTHLNLD